MSGFTRSYRSKWEHPIFRDLLEAAIWAWICDSAVWRRTKINYCGQMVELERGQLLTSRSFIAKGFRVGEQSVRTLLARLEKDAMIAQRPTSHGTIITICNYEKYQSNSNDDSFNQDQQLTSRFTENDDHSSKINQPLTSQLTSLSNCNLDKKSLSSPATNQPTNKRLTSRQPATNQNKKEGNEVKEGNEGIYSSPDFQIMFQDFWSRYPNKVGKTAALKAYLTARKETANETIIRGLERYVAANPWRGELRFCKHPATWLNSSGWLDEYTSEQPGKPNRPSRRGNSDYERGIMASLAGAKEPTDKI